MVQHADVHAEMHISHYWRMQLGEMEYVNYDADDLRRWYIALETRGPEEIRSYLQERNSRFPMPTVTGIVAAAPHPPLAIVEIWLNSHDHVRTGPLWLGFAGFCSISLLIAMGFLGCQNLKSLDKLATKPPGSATIQTRQPLPFGAPPTATMPVQPPPPPSSQATQQSSQPR